MPEVGAGGEMGVYGASGRSPVRFALTVQSAEALERGAANLELLRRLPDQRQSSSHGTGMGKGISTGKHGVSTGMGTALPAYC